MSNKSSEKTEPQKVDTDDDLTSSEEAEPVHDAIPEDFPSSEEFSDEDNDQKEKILDYFLINIVQNILKDTHESIDEVISTLREGEDRRLDKLREFLTRCKIKGKVTPQILDKHLKKFIAQFVAPPNNKSNHKKDEAEKLRECDDLKFYLDIFNFTPDTIVKINDNKQYSIIMLACENLENPYLLDVLINDLNGDIKEAEYNKKTLTPLLTSCSLGNLAAVTLLVDAGADVNYGKRPLGTALVHRHHHVVEYLLTLEDLDVVSYIDGSSPLLLAAEYTTANNFFVLMRKAPDQINILTTRNESALNFALLRDSQNEADRSERDCIIRMLLRYPGFTVDLNSTANGETPLFLAARVNNLTAVKLLLVKKCDPNFIATSGPYKGHSVISIAVYLGHVEIVEFLINICKLDFLTPFTISTLKFDYTLIPLSHANPKFKENIKAHATIYNLLKSWWSEHHPDQVRAHINRLIKVGDLNLIRSWKKFILSKACIMPDTSNTPLHTAAVNGKDQVIHCLIVDIGCPIDPQNLKGDTPLHLASRKSHSQAVKQLLHLGADRNRLNNELISPFGLARSSQNRACIQAFIEYTYNSGLELPSVESARAENDNFFVSIIEEFLSKTAQTTQNTTADDNPSQEGLNVSADTTQTTKKRKKKRKKNKNRNKEGNSSPKADDENSAPQEHKLSPEGEIRSLEQDLAPEGDVTSPPEQNLINESDETPHSDQELDLENSATSPPHHELPPENDAASPPEQDLINESDETPHSDQELDLENGATSPQDQKSVTEDDATPPLSQEIETDQSMASASDGEDMPTSNGVRHPSLHSVIEVGMQTCMPDPIQNKLSFFSHPIWPGNNANHSSQTTSLNSASPLIDSLTESIEATFRKIMLNQSEEKLLDDLGELARHYPMLNYHVNTLNEIPVNSIVFVFIKSLHRVLHNTNVLDKIDPAFWKEHADRLYLSMKREGIDFSLSERSVFSVKP